MLPQGLPWEGVILSLLEIYESSMQMPLFRACSMLKVPQNEQGLQSVTPRAEAKLSVRDLVLTHAPISDQGPQHISIHAVHGSTHSQHAVGITQ